MALSEEFKLDFKFGGNAEFLSKLETLMQRVDARFDSVESAVKSTTDATDNMADAVDDLNDSFKDGMKSASAFGEKLKDLARYYISFQAIRSGAERVWSFGQQSMDAYSTQERAENQLKGVLQNRGSLDQFQTIKDYAAEIQGRSIYGDEAMIKGAGELATYVKGTESLKSMMDLLTNYAAGMTGGGEVSPEQMESLATGLGMAYDGNYMAMRRKGFDTSKLEALDALAENGGKWNAKLMQKYGSDWDKEQIADFENIVKQAKASGGVTEQMRVDALKESLADWDKLSDTVNGLDSSAIVRFNNKMGDLRENIGKKIYPAFNKLVDSIDKHMPNIEKMFNAVGEAFERIAETLDDNLDALIDFGKWVANGIPKLAEFGKNVAGLVGKFVDMQGAVKLLVAYLAVDKIREFAAEFNKVFTGNGEEGGVLGTINVFLDAMEGDEGLIGAFDKLSKSAVGSQIAIAGIAWGLSQIAELIDVFGQWVDQKKLEKETREQSKLRSGAADQMIAARKAYLAGNLSEEEYKRKFDTINGIMKGQFTGSYFDIWNKGKNVAKSAQKEAKGTLYQQFNNTNIEQNVSLSADIQKVGILLNQSVRAIIEKQLKQNREVSLATGI